MCIFYLYFYLYYNAKIYSNIIIVEYNNICTFLPSTYLSIFNYYFQEIKILKIYLIVLWFQQYKFEFLIK